MTITETRPDEAAPADARPAGGWLATADHKRIGLTYLVAALVFAIASGVLGELLRLELNSSGVQIVGQQGARIFSAHATMAALLFLAPAWVGLAAYLVPLQIGAARLAFPRLMAFALWTYLSGGVLLCVSYVVNSAPTRDGGWLLGIVNSVPPGAPNNGPAGSASVLWIVSLMLVGLAAVLAAAVLATTILKLRVEGLTLSRIPMFSTATLVTSLGVLVATPMFLAGLVLLYIDHWAGGQILTSPGGQSVWSHTVWLYGRPEVYLLTLPALGAAADMVATHARRPFLDARPLQFALGAFGVLAFGALWTPHDAAKALILPNPPALNAVLGALIGIVVLVLLGTLARGRPRGHISLLFVAGFILLLVFAAANDIAAAVASVHGHAFTDGQIHVAVFGAPTLVLAGALFHWAPKLFGRFLSAAAGGAAFLLLFGGFLLVGLGDYLLGYNGAGHQVIDYGSGHNWGTYSQLGTVGGILIALGALVVLAEVVRALASRGAAAPADPYDGLTLEWATASPPSAANFDSVPEVRSAYPVYDLRGTD
jgi:cytochrome c oxidase subunit 1